MTGARVLLVGAHGHGRAHLANLRRLARHSDHRLVGLCDVRPLDDKLRGDLADPAGPAGPAGGEVAFSDSLDELLGRRGADVTIIATPIHTHVDLALTAMRAGSHVLLEKPPAASLPEYLRLLEGAEASGRACQVGFQSLGSSALPAVAAMVAAGSVGEVRGIGAAGAWTRDMSYYDRAPWAGRRSLDGMPVVDGALTNPFAHAVVTALRLDGSAGAGSLRRIETELYRANPIEADDTSCVRLTTSRGSTITVAVTLCAATPSDPYVRVHGTRGRITFWYKTDQVQLERAAGAPGGAVETAEHASTDLLENLIAHIRDPGVELLAPLPGCHAFMEVLEAVRAAPDPSVIDAAHQRTDRAGGHERRVVDGVEAAVHDAARELRLFHELGLPWAGSSAVATRSPSPAVEKGTHRDGTP